MRYLATMTFVIILTISFVVALFLSKKIAVALRMDGKRELLKEYLDETFPAWFLTKIYAGISFIYLMFSPHDDTIYTIMFYTLWCFLDNIPRYAWIWEPEEADDGSEENKNKPVELYKVFTEAATLLGSYYLADFLAELLWLAIWG